MTEPVLAGPERVSSVDGTAIAYWYGRGWAAFAAGARGDVGPSALADHAAGAATSDGGHDEPARPWRLPADWVGMQVPGYRASQSFMSYSDIRAWVTTVALNLARIAPDSPPSPELTAALDENPGMFRMAALAGLPEPHLARG